MSERVKVVLVLAAIVLLVLAASIGSLVVAMSTEPAPVVVYNDAEAPVEVIAPLEAGPLCPGDVVTYPVTVTIHTAPALIHVVEGWCRADGICLNELLSDYYLPVTETSTVVATARRTVPQSARLTAGTWELRHVSENGAVSAYVVRPIVIGECPP